MLEEMLDDFGIEVESMKGDRAGMTRSLTADEALAAKPAESCGGPDVRWMNSDGLPGHSATGRPTRS